MPAYLITNVRILDGTGREPFAGSVRVEGNRIAEVTSASEVTTAPAPSSSPARSPISCWWTAIRSPTSRSSRTAPRSA